MTEPSPLRYIVNHVFLPPNLPQKDDQPESYYANDHDLALLTLRCASKFCEQAARSDEELSVRWKPILAMLKNFAHLNDAEPFTTDDLRDRLTSLSDGGTRYIFPRQFSIYNADRYARVTDQKTEHRTHYPRTIR
jgi:hypothetical protein